MLNITQMKPPKFLYGAYFPSQRNMKEIIRRKFVTSLDQSILFIFRS